ncbi:MAG: valine--pyruvate transaminase [Spirochaetales bacterium]|nr:valine--pyruvate transaminase [Spirochaetales bacterium]
MTQFAQRFCKKTGILELMDDLGQAMAGSTEMRMLGGGNPAHIPEINQLWRARTQEILNNGQELEETLANYDTPRGKESFLEAMAELLNQKFGWNLTGKNIAITNGSQTAFFLLLNLFSGHDTKGQLNRVMFPLCPEYIGYADQAVEEGALATRPAKINLTRPGFFKYGVDFDNLEISDDIGALCVSRPTNPTGNVLTDQEVHKLSALAASKDIPFIIDNAYGAPFPNILFREATPFWDHHVILSMSLSKLGLPSVRTGILVGSEEIIDAVSACNAVLSLSNGSLGQTLVHPLVKNGDLLRISDEIIRPFYAERAKTAIESMQDAFSTDIPYRLHECEGALFLWLWLPELPISSFELYQRLKKRNVLVVSGHYFFYGLEEDWDHSKQCLRLSYAQDPQDFRDAAFIMADEIRKIMDQNP